MNHALTSPSGFTPLQNGEERDLDHAAATAAAALSHEHTPTQNNNARKRKATAAVPGSRGVANLTPDQLAKKRANDREAQRAIRQRTKDTIDTLANRIKELENQQPFQELQKVVQERDRALQECEDLKKKLATVASVIGGNIDQQQVQAGASQQPNLHGMFDAFEEFIGPTLLTGSETELAAITAQQSPLPPLSTPTAPSAYPQPPTSNGTSFEQQHIHPDLRSPHSAPASSPGSQGASISSTYQSDGPASRRWSPSLEQQPRRQYSPQNSAGYDSRQAPASQMQSQSNGERLGLSYVLEPRHNSTKASPLAANQYTSSPVQAQPAHARLPNNSTPSCPLDSLLLDFFSGRRQKYDQGIPMNDIAGPDYPYFYALLDPTAVYSKNCHPLSALLIDILSKFPYIDALPEKVAVLYIMFVLLRWEICPCEKCFEQIPEWARPIKEQLEIGHPAWYDHVPWPVIRKNLILLPNVKFEDFFIPFTSGLCINWPYPKDMVLLPTQPRNAEDPNALSINPIFEAHLRNLDNWSLGLKFHADCGHLIDDSVRIEDVGVNHPR